MKTKVLLPSLLTFCLLAFGVHAWADDDDQNDQGENQDEQGEDCQGGDIGGSENLVATVSLIATTNGPADASGLATLVSDNEDGVVTYSFSLSVTGLTAGTYTLSAVKKSDASTVGIGQFTVGTSCHQGGDDGDDEGEENDGGGGGHTNDLGQIVTFLDKIELPAGLDPLDIGQIIISDSIGTALLTGDLVNPAATSTIKFTAKVKAVSASGGSVSSASKVSINTAQAKSTVKRGKHTDRFTMVASGVTPNSTFSVMVNGLKAGAVKSNNKGKVLIRKLPANLLVVRSVHLVDANGKTAVRAKF